MSDKKLAETQAAEKTKRETCGIVMPISAIDNCTEAHWADVREILSSAIEEAGFEPNLVSNADDVGIIQQRIIQNLYLNPIVVCDVSAKNPNVMFELGLRLAFDKPTIIVKDEITSYSFDTASIEHLTYPRDLRFARIVAFKSELTAKIKKTYSKAKGDPKYTTFLKHFGTFKVAKVETEEVTQVELILEELKSIRSQLSATQTTRSSRFLISPPPAVFVEVSAEISLNGASVESILHRLPRDLSANLQHVGENVGKANLVFTVAPADSEQLVKFLKTSFGSRLTSVGTELLLNEEPHDQSR